MTLRNLLVPFILCAAASAAHAQPKPPDAPVAPKPEQAANKGGVKKLFEIIKQEPTIKDVQGAVLKFYKLEPSRIHGMATAARLKGLIPELEGSVDNMVGHSFTNMRDGLYPVLPSPAT